MDFLLIFGSDYEFYISEKCKSFLCYRILERFGGCAAEPEAVKSVRSGG